MILIWVSLVFVFLLQLIGFYFMALLYTKVSKFDDLEKKQRKLMTEMDDSIGAYLSELKDENERLIERLAARDAMPAVQTTNSNEVSGVQELAAAVEKQQPVIRVNRPVIPVNLALKSYSKAATVAAEPEPVVEELVAEEDDVRTKTFKLHDAGQTVEEIAKELGKGRTEIELFLKFR